MGAKKRPSYRVVVADSHSPRDGRFIETIGFYDPLTNPPTARVDVEKARTWLSHGAQPTDAVERILRWTGVVDASSAPVMTTAAAVATPPAAAEAEATD